MKINENVKIIGENVVLVPYRKCHVEKYHNWTKSEELQEMMGVEPLTLKEEYEKQKKWSEDEDKCTFIILDRAEYEFSNNEVESMIGGTNIFIIDQDVNYAIGEIEIVIAEESARGKKFGWEAVILMMLYGIKYIGLISFEAKILSGNTKGIRMFEKLQFRKMSSVGAFEELTMEKAVTEEWVDWLKRQCPWQMQTYNKPTVT